MTLAYVLGGGLNDAPGMGAGLYDQYPAVQRCFKEVQEWTGLDIQALLAQPLPSERAARRGLGQIRQSALVLAVSDVLAEHGLHPGVVGGLSLGAMIGGCLAGAVDREDYFRYLLALREGPLLSPDEPPQGVAILVVPGDADPGALCGPDHPGLYLAADVGPIAQGARRMAILAGYESALRALAEELPTGAVTVVENRPVAFHSPLQQYLADYLAPHIDALPFKDARVPLLSCLEPRTLTGAQEIQDLFRRNTTETVSVPHLRSGFERHDAQLGLVLGPSKAEQFASWPFPVVHIEAPEHVTEAITAVHELGISTDEVPAAGIR